MLNYLLVKEDGSEIGSTIILSCTLTTSVNSENEFTLGSACTDEIEVEYIAADEKLIAPKHRRLAAFIADAILAHLHDGVQVVGQPPELSPLLTCQFHIRSSPKTLSDWRQRPAGHCRGGKRRSSPPPSAGRRSCAGTAQKTPDRNRTRPHP